MAGQSDDVAKPDKSSKTIASRVLKNVTLSRLVVSRRVENQWIRRRDGRDDESLRHRAPSPPLTPYPFLPSSSMRSSSSFLLLGLATLVCGVLAQESSDPPCPSINMTTVGTLSEPCSDPTLACSHEQGCVGAMFKWLAPQFDEQRMDFNASAYEDVTPEWMIKCMAPTLPAWLDAIPITTFMELQKCEYDGYLAQYPELAALDFSSVTTQDFLRHMPPAMLMDILRATRSQQ